MNILITSAGRRVSLVQAFQKELKKLFPKGKVMTTDVNTRLSAACAVSDQAFLVPSVHDKDYINTLMALCLSNKIKLLIPTLDTELLLLAQHKKVFLDEGIHMVVSSPDFIGLCRNKRDTHQFFKKHHIVTAKEYTKDDYRLPLFIKPLNGSRSIDTFIITHPDELAPYHFTNDNLMFLEYLNHDAFEEFTCDLYYDQHHDLKCVVPRKRIEVREGEVSKGLTEKNVLMDVIGLRLSHIEGAVGCLTTQFFKHKETDAIYGIEINARFGGGFPLTYLSGANYVKWLIEEYLLGKPIPFFSDWEDQLLMLRFDQEILIHEDKR